MSYDVKVRQYKSRFGKEYLLKRTLIVLLLVRAKRGGKVTEASLPP